MLSMGNSIRRIKSFGYIINFEAGASHPVRVRESLAADGLRTLHLRDSHMADDPLDLSPVGLTQ